MEKKRKKNWSPLVLVALALAEIAGARATEPELRFPVVSFHARAAGCWLAAASRPMQMRLVCVEEDPRPREVPRPRARRAPESGTRTLSA